MVSLSTKRVREKRLEVNERFPRTFSFISEGSVSHKSQFELKSVSKVLSPRL